MVSACRISAISSNANKANIKATRLRTNILPTRFLEFLNESRGGGGGDVAILANFLWLLLILIPDKLCSRSELSSFHFSQSVE